MHQRQTIREAIHTALLNNTTAAARVSRNRLNPYRIKELPAIDIVSVADDVEPDSVDTAPRELEHSYSVGVRGWVAVTDDVDDVMDDLAQEIETLMYADPYFGGATADSILTGTSFDFSPQGDLDAGSVTLLYDFKYQTQAPEPPVGLDDFNTAHATHKQGAAQHDDDDAEDDITVQVP